ncbi:hypothetical protein [Prescottella equi]|uniref:Uncharacterized protein n=1 Tax=Rhodococcus phage REQ3 TaxID=1109714 RepID=G9FH54_9CAUD|nr:hypothetical protein [Prescottella equi]YP_005087199.1 hypothetical protein RoPhREQ3_gp07 [Rhodococcus phage REQ3]AEV51943.1 hypothetical protein [Rhodococcus phage REQ3]ERN43281.1 hypothetical protein H849_24469 [Prescottella equi NBRC 101255 = C 7]ORL29037.1 hypothetical protein A6I89_01770 [Prescottella equi]QPQ77297.1 hypothetical protein I6H09_00190 [Prescottella equi]SUE04849.1 Uncharacterised protein [Prescottella equi]
MSNPRNWARHIADIPTTNDHEIAIGAQFHVDDDGTEHRLIVIDGHAIDISQVGDLSDALNRAVAAHT